MKDKTASPAFECPPRVANHRRILLAVLIVSGLLMGITAWFSPVYEGGADAFHHYQIIRYAWKHPSLFLDLWGKPILTLLASPFALLGIGGVSVFSILCALCVAWRATEIAKRLGLCYPVLGAVLILFSPEYFTSSIAPMTETLFSLFLVLGIDWFTRRQYIVSAVVVSFLPLIRSEGYILFPLFAIAFVWERRWAAIPFIATGWLIYSLIGWYQFGDYLWLIHQSPYSLQNNPCYGHGGLLHFVRALPQSAGYPMCILLVIGLLSWLFQCIRHGRWPVDSQFKATVLILGCTGVYFVAHSYVWWRGIGSSLGLIRVIAAIIPLMGILALLGLQPLIHWTARYRFLPGVLLTGLIGWGVCQPFIHKKLPLTYQSCSRPEIAASVWLKRHGLDRATIYYYDPFIFYLLGKDPYDRREGMRLWYDFVPPADSMMPGEILVWDSGLGYIEGHVRSGDLERDSRLILLSAFRGVDSIQTRPGINEEVLVYMKIANDSPLAPSMRETGGAEKENNVGTD